jgi:hypothetical protein
MNLNRTIFWDTDFETIDWQKQRREIIERVLHFGDLGDWREIQNFYGREIIKNEVTKSRYLNNRVLNFCSVIFDLPLNQFRCYNTESSIRQHWNY